MEKNKNGNMQLRKMTFFPPFILLLADCCCQPYQQRYILNLINNINNWIIANVGWVFSIIAVGTVLVAIAAAFSKFGNVRIGGEDAKPEISTFSWFYDCPYNDYGGGRPFLGTCGANCPSERSSHGADRNSSDEQ